MKRTIPALVLLMASVGNAQAQSVDDPVYREAINNASHEAIECAAYYTMMKAFFKLSGRTDEMPATLDGTIYNMMERSITLGRSIKLKEETITARFKMASDSMIDATDGNAMNAAILMDKYGAVCAEAHHNKSDRLAYWVWKAMAKRVDHQVPSKLPKTGR